MMAVFAICASAFANFTAVTEAAEVYSADFTALVKDGARTEYGTAADIIAIDSYTTADLSYAGTYVTADGKVYIKSGTVCNKNGNYAKGSHISFTAPSDGKLVVTGADIGWFEGDTYRGYNAKIEIDAKEGVTYHFGWRKDSTYIDSLTFTATANPSIADGYEAVTDKALPYMVSKPEQTGEYPLVVFLHSVKRNGTDNVSQLKDAQYLFDILKSKAVLAAPQTADAWDADTLNAFIAELEAEYSPSEVVIAGQDEGAVVAYSVTDADKIIAIGGTANTAAAETDAKVWAFANNDDANIAAIRNAVNAMQSGGYDVLYTEFPYSTDGTAAEQAANTAGLADWILNDTERPKTVDLVLFAGQSNMAGRGDYADAAPVMPYHGFEYHPVTEPGVLSTVTEPFGKYENNDTVNDNSGQGVDRRSGDMVSAFIESYYETSGVPVVGVQCSRGGTGTDYWKGAVLTEAADRYKEAEEYLTNAGYTVGKKILVWCQGCTDADKNRSDDTYKANTRAIFDTIKSGTGITDVFMIRIGHCKTSGAAAIDEAKDPVYKRINLAQKALADANEDITAVASFYTDEYAALMRDQYHYHQGAYNSIGKIAGNNTAVTLYNTGEWIKYPEPDEVVETPAPATPEPAFEITSSDTEIDVSGMKNYGTDTYRVYKSDGSFETVTAANGKIANTTGGEIVVVPEYKFEFTNQTSPTDANIKGYVKVVQNSYTAEKGYGLTNSDYHINQNGCLAKKDDNNPIKIDLADGFYDITLYRLGGGRADIYANGKLIANNTTSNTSQNRGGASAVMEISSVKLDSGTTDITFGNLSGNNERIASLKIARVPEKFRKPVIWIAGDSEAANYYPIDADGDDLKSNKIMITGFGQQLGKLLSDKYSVSNYGQPSATVKTWYDECFESVNELMQKGDTILIDFGINEVASSSNKLTIEQMEEHITTIANAAKEKGVTPILVSPVYNGKYQSKAYFTYNASTKTNAMTAFTEELGIESIDLNKWTQLYANAAIAQTGDSAWLTNNYHVSDNLHLTQHSAVLAASFIAAEMEEMGYETTDFADAYTDISSIGEGNIRGNETENKREYSVAAAKAFMADGTVTKPTDKPNPTDMPTPDSPPTPTNTPAPTDTPAPLDTPKPDGTPSPADTPKPDGTPKPSDAPEYPVTVSYDAQSKKLTLTASGGITNAVVIKATYDGDKMSDVKIYPAEFADNTAVIENIEANVNDKIFVWNSTADMKPLAPAFTAAR